MSTIIISNNPSVWNKYPSTIRVDGNFKDVLIEARNAIHLGQCLLTHPLTGSIKPNQTPYKSIILNKPQETKSVDLESLQLIEGALKVADRFGSVKAKLNKDILKDFQVIDLSFIESALDSLKPLGIG